MPANEYRVVYDPPQTMLGKNRHWQPILWKYYHIREGCLTPLAIQLEGVFQGRHGSASSTASFIECKGWDLQIDIAPLPKRFEETREQRQATTAEALRLLNVPFAAAI